MSEEKRFYNLKAIIIGDNGVGKRSLIDAISDIRTPIFDMFS